MQGVSEALEQPVGVGGHLVDGEVRLAILPCSTASDIA